jgi:hypothetical protein
MDWGTQDRQHAPITSLSEVVHSATPQTRARVSHTRDGNRIGSVVVCRPSPAARWPSLTSHEGGSRRKVAAAIPVLSSSTKAVGEQKNRRGRPGGGMSEMGDPAVNIQLLFGAGPVEILAACCASRYFPGYEHFPFNRQASRQPHIGRRHLEDDVSNIGLPSCKAAMKRNRSSTRPVSAVCASWYARL